MCLVFHDHAIEMLARFVSHDPKLVKKSTSLILEISRAAFKVKSASLMIH
ncbi:MAG: hypothetical protein ACLFOA_04750 [Desulfohalobiaceae bacterium]